MKSKTLALITLSLITAATLILTAGLSLLHGSATENLPITDEPNRFDSAVPESDISESTVSETTSESNIELPSENSEYVYPKYTYTECDVNTTYIDGDDIGNGVVIDVYSHKSGKLVGQLSFTSKEITDYITSLVREGFSPENELWIVKDEACVPLPEGDYRIEVYAGTWFSYTYGNGDIFELTQCTLTFAGGEKLTGYIDFLISDLIAEIEAGDISAPDSEKAVSKLLFRGLEGYWEGYYIEELDRYVPAAGRFCERFPYID